MSRLYPSYMPDYIFHKTTNISVDFLAKNNINCLLLDVDNTLAMHGCPKPATGIVEWLKSMQAANIKLIITSNNYKKRVKPFAQTIGLDYISFSAKPTPLGFKKALKKVGGDPKHTLVVGDQLFTDVLGAHLLGMKAAMVLPIQEEKGLGFVIKRKFEKAYIQEYKNTRGDFL